MANGDLQSKNNKKGERFERKILEKIGNSCAFSARVSETSGGHSTPDLVCVQDTSKGLSDVTRLAEVKYNGYIEPDQRDELVKIAERSPDHVQLEVHHRTSPRKEKKRTIKKPGWDTEKTREILETEFNHKKFDKQEWKKNN